MNKKRLFFDMDGVLVDFQSGIDKLSEDVKREYEGRLDEVPGIFSLMDPMPGAIEAARILSEYYDVYILSTAPWKNPTAASDKVAWVTKYLDDVFHKRMVLTHCKNNLSLYNRVEGFAICSHKAEFFILYYTCIFLAHFFITIEKLVFFVRR